MARRNTDDNSISKSGGGNDPGEGFMQDTLGGVGHGHAIESNAPANELNTSKSSKNESNTSRSSKNESNTSRSSKKGSKPPGSNTSGPNTGVEPVKPIEQHIIDTLESNYMPYLMSVIVSRAIPEIDGFKPSHRKLLYTMYNMGLSGTQRTKSANVVGQTMKLNPHGDLAIYDTLVRLTRGYDALIQAYVDSKGNFGKSYSRDMQCAAARYTEVRLEKICEELFSDLDKDAVDFTDNYDGTMKEPVLLPVTFPTVLVNSNQGIAVGMASSICSFNLHEVCDTTVRYIQDSSCDLSETLKAPDFSVGGQLLYNKPVMDDIYATGRGGFKLRARYRHDRKNSCIEIYEIPYTTTIEEIMDSIIEAIKAGKLRDISDVRDETDLDGLKLTIDIRKSTDADSLMMKLFRMTPLENSFNCNFNILVNGSPKVMGIRDILKEWLAFRMDCVKRRIAFEIEKKADRLHLLQGLNRIILDIDKAIRIVRGTDRDENVVPALMQGFGIDERQAEFVAEIKLRNLNKEYILQKTADIEILLNDIANLKGTLADDDKIKKLIMKQIEEIAKKYGKPRRTEVISGESAPAVAVEHLVDDYKLKFFLTAHNYLKKIPLASLRANPEHKLKEEDAIIQECDAHNLSEILFFSDKCAVYKMKVHEIEDCKASSLGEYLANLLKLDEDEKILYITVTDDYSGFMIFAFENGKISKVPLDSYSTKTNRKRLANAYSGSSPVVGMMYLKEDTDLIVYSSIKKVLLFNTSLINPKSTRDAQGVQVLKSKKNSKLTGLIPSESAGFAKPNYYRANIPAVGCYLKTEDKGILK